MVKANAYGHGAVEVARAALAGGADPARRRRPRRGARSSAPPASTRRSSRGCTIPTPTSRRRSRAGVEIGVSSLDQLERAAARGIRRRPGRARAPQDRHRAQPQRRARGALGRGRRARGRARARRAARRGRRVQPLRQHVARRRRRAARGVRARARRGGRRRAATRPCATSPRPSRRSATRGRATTSCASASAIYGLTPVRRRHHLHRPRAHARDDPARPGRRRAPRRRGRRGLLRPHLARRARRRPSRSCRSATPTASRATPRAAAPRCCSRAHDARSSAGSRWTSSSSTSATRPSRSATRSCVFGDPATGAPDRRRVGRGIAARSATRSSRASARGCRACRRSRLGGRADRACIERRLERPDGRMEAFGRELGAQLRAGDLVRAHRPARRRQDHADPRHRRRARRARARCRVRRSCSRAPIRTSSAVPPLVHVDAYRLGDAALLDDLDLDFDGSVVVVEWGAGLVDDVSESWLEIVIERPTGASRRSMPRRRGRGRPTSSTPTSRARSTVHGVRAALGGHARTPRARRLDPMLLAIDTSTGTSVAVVDRDRATGELRCLAETGTDDTMRHAEVIGGFIRDALAEAAVDRRDALGRRRRAWAPARSPGCASASRPRTRSRSASAGRSCRSSATTRSRWSRYRDGGTGPAAGGHRRAPARVRGLRVRRPRRRRAARARRAVPSCVPRDDGARGDGASDSTRDRVPAGAVGMLAELAFAAGRLPLADDAPLYLRAPDVTPSPGKRVLQ